MTIDRVSHVPKAGIVLDASRLDEALFTDDAGSESLKRLQTGGRGGMQDALILLTASGRTDALVTDDGALAIRAEDR
jgi:hypothetical protein